LDLLNLQQLLLQMESQIENRKSEIENVLVEHFLNPRNVGDAGEPGFAGRAVSFVCGASTRFSIQIDEHQHVSEAKFRAAGCEVLIALLSLLTERVQSKSTAEAATVGQSVKELIAELELTGDRHHCAQLACDALLAAVRGFSEAARQEWNGDEALICTCFFVSEQTIAREIQTKELTTVREVTAACSAGGGCGSCQPLIVELLEAARLD
jgi:NifU-like protein